MVTPFATTLAAWHDFYCLIGAAAATLIGLMFVAVTFGANVIKTAPTGATRAFVDPAVTHFVQVLVTSCLVLVPSMQPSVFGGVLALIGSYRLSALVRVHRHFRDAQKKSGDLELSDWMTGIVVPLVTHLGLIGCGIAFVLGHVPLDGLTLVTLAVLLNGIYSAWELVLWIAVLQVKSSE